MLDQVLPSLAPTARAERLSLLCVAAADAAADAPHQWCPAPPEGAPEAAAFYMTYYLIAYNAWCSAALERGLRGRR